MELRAASNLGTSLTLQQMRGSVKGAFAVLITLGGVVTVLYMRAARSLCLIKRWKFEHLLMQCALRAFAYRLSIDIYIATRNMLITSAHISEYI